jgi:hypothetical protein
MRNTVACILAVALLAGSIILFRPKPVEKVVYIDKPVDRVVYVDRPVVQEKVVYVEKVVEKPIGGCNCHFQHSTRIYCPVHSRWH